MGLPNSNVQSIAATRFPSHQLSNGLYVSGLPDQYKEKGPTMSVSQMPYTGGDVKKSGELGKMFDIPVECSNPEKQKILGTVPSLPKATSCGAFSSHSGPLPSERLMPLLRLGSLTTSGSTKTVFKLGNQASKSGPLTGSMGVTTQKCSNSGPCESGDQLCIGSLKTIQGGTVDSISGNLSSRSSNSLKTSGPLPILLPTTGLISGPICLGPLSSASGLRTSLSGPSDTSGTPVKLLSGPGACSSAVNSLSHDQEFSFGRSFPKVVLWTVVPLFVMGFIAGAFIIAAVKNAVLLVIVAALFVALVVILLWNTWWGKNSVTRFLAKYPDSELRSVKDGQYVKVTGVVTCGSVPLESSYQKVSRCLYTSTGLYEYRGLFSKPANRNHRWFTWGVRHMERHVVDFYISDFQTGMRALVKAGFGARITPYVQEIAVVELTSKGSEFPPAFLRWLTERKLSIDDRFVKLKEGYIKEGSIVTVLGVVQRQDNVLMIVPPSEVVSTGCQWTKFLLPANLQGIILACDEEATKLEGIPL
ncbi:unnamed protein product [Calypogeia fissa]